MAGGRGCRRGGGAPHGQRQHEAGVVQLRRQPLAPSATSAGSLQRLPTTSSRALQPPTTMDPTGGRGGNWRGGAGGAAGEQVFPAPPAQVLQRAYVLTDSGKEPFREPLW
jgi:hypothetical protein